MKDDLPLDRRHFFRFLKFRITKPEAFRAGRMMRIDELSTRDRGDVESLRPSWRNAGFVLNENEITTGAHVFPLVAEEFAMLSAIDGKRTIGEIVAFGGEPDGSYARFLRLTTKLLRQGVLDLNA